MLYASEGITIGLRPTTLGLRTCSNSIRNAVLVKNYAQFYCSYFRMVSHCQCIYTVRMRILLQRVTQASVSVDKQVVGSIERGYLLFLGVMQGDTEEQALWLARKISALRLFNGEDGKINDLNILDIVGEALVVSQFTLAGDFKKGNRPDYTASSSPDEATKLYEYFIDALKKEGIQNVQSGTFGAMMQVSLTNDGPVTLWLERTSS